MLSQSRTDQLSPLFAPELASNVSGRTRKQNWKCRLSEMLVGDYLILPLTSAKMIKSEGYLMGNCCRDYIKQCAELTYCVFSIRSRSGERLATLGLSYNEGYWRVNQCLGLSNTNVVEETREYLDDDGVFQTEWFATELYYVSHEVARLMNSPVDCH